MKKSTILAFIAVAAAGAVLASQIVLAHGDQVDPRAGNYNPERHEMMMEAFEKNDYNKWKEVFPGKVREFVNEENFPKFAEMHRLMEEGKYDEAEKIREELGMGDCEGRGMFESRRAGMGWQR